MSRKTNDLHPWVRKLCENLVIRAMNAGVPIVVTQTLRTVQEQDALYAQGRNAPGKIVTYAKGGSSYHNYGLAFDIALATQGGVSWDTKADINDNPIPDFFEVGKIGEECGLEWGGRWRGKKQDLPHFQFTFGLTIPELFDGKLPPEE